MSAKVIAHIFSHGGQDRVIIKTIEDADTAHELHTSTFRIFPIQVGVQTSKDSLHTAIDEINQ